ncbi:hybrid sensor histidine kinase/response regulator [Maricaulis sp.]|uniref:ATP-binding response regulator n=1 Tax=Maricaulis sp. TaxID=1486257 RepID=UPI003A945E2C
MRETGRESEAAAAALWEANAGLDEVHLGQARLLRAGTSQSCLIISGVTLYLSALIALTGDLQFAAIWLAATGAMIAVVYAYARLMAPEGINPENYRRYLTGHTVISGVTGLVWGGLASAFFDPSSVLNMFIAVNMVFSITVGGMMPSAEYRPTFISLATAALLPFSAYWLLTVEGPLRLIGIGLLIYYAFGLLVSARAEVQTIASLAAERTRHLTQQLQEQNRIIERASASKSRFLAATSHDMSQPLQAQGFFIGAIRRTLDQPEQIELLDKIEAAWRSQQQLLQALVETARLDSGAIIARIRPFSLEAVLNDLRAEFADMAHTKSIELIIARTAVDVNSDALLVTRILRNLLSNAIKFTPPGGQVELRCAMAEDGLLVEVSDDGPGVTEAERERIFEEYVQLQPGPAGSERGLGLGLTIVRQLARKLDLELRFASTPGEGTRAGIVLPLATAPVASRPGQARPGGLAGSPLVMLVEDEPAVREGLTILLTDWGCRVLAAGSGAEALELLSWADAEPDLLIVDKRLAGGEDGLETVQALRTEVVADIPAVLLTGDIYQFEAVTGMEQITVLPKPADPAQLHAILLEALEQPQS